MQLPERLWRANPISTRRVRGGVIRGVDTMKSSTRAAVSNVR